MRLNLYQIGCTISLYMYGDNALTLTKDEQPDQFAETDAELADSYVDENEKMLAQTYKMTDT